MKNLKKFAQKTGNKKLESIASMDIKHEDGPSGKHDYDDDEDDGKERMQRGLKKAKGKMFTDNDKDCY